MYLILCTFSGGTVPSQYLQLPVSVQMTEMLTAPIVKIKVLKMCSFIIKAEIDWELNIKL